MYQFRDPIHGFISLTDDECALIDTPPFQRLRRIAQLATTSLVYHGAEHTRFGHSLGVMHLTSLVFDSIIDKNPNLFEGDENRIAYYRQLLRLVGLTHDLGHAPFSHASEELFELGLEHEDYTRMILDDTRVKSRLKRINHAFQKKHGSDFQINSETVWLAYTCNNPALLKDNYHDFLFMKSLMDGELDCDKMDYLLRDSYYCGVNYGKYDLGRLVESFTVYTGADEHPRLAVTSDGVQAVEEFILARYFMFIQVYFHKTRRLLDKNLIACLTHILPGGKYPTNVEEYLNWDDSRVLAAIGKLYTEQKDDAISVFYDRKTMSCVFASKSHANGDTHSLFKLAVKIAKEQLEKLGVSKEEINKHIVIDNPRKVVHKISDDYNDEKGIPVVRHSGKASSLLQESVLLDSLKDNEISMERIYVSTEYQEEIKRLLADYL